MKTRWHLFILFIFIGTLGSAAYAHKNTSTKGKKWNKLKVKPMGARRSSQKVPGGASQPQISSLLSTTPVTPPVRPGEPRARTQSDSAYVPDVSVTCSTSEFVVRVKTAFYGLGADAQELTLGSSCKSNGVVRPQGDLLFTYPVTECGAKRELPPGYLVYKYVLHYEPSPKRFPSNAHQINVNIECHYQRDQSVYQLAVQPTWHTVIMRKKLKGRSMDFQIKLMDDSWTPAKSQVYLLGQTVNIQVSAPHLPPGLKLYINSCYATPPSSSKSSLKYAMIDNFGCMVDSKHDPGASQFISRTDNTIRFSLRAFQFTADPELEIGIHCKLSVASEDPGPAHKSCTYQGQRWRALTGRDSVCECCESTCTTSKPRRALMEGFARSGLLLVSDQPSAAEDDLQPNGPSAGGGEMENINFYTDTNVHEKLWEHLRAEDYNGYKEKQPFEQSDVILGLLGEPDLAEERSFEEGEVKDLNTGEGGSGYDTKDVSEDIGEENDDLLLQMELESADPEEGKDEKRACSKTKNRRKVKQDNLVDKEAKTWIFKWK
nr:uncharacterized protein si:ch211-67f13.7 [Nothobranchius furzeri]